MFSCDRSLPVGRIGRPKTRLFKLSSPGTRLLVTTIGSAEVLVESGVYAARATASIIMVSNSTGVSFPSRRCLRFR